jgi:glycosyltransferase involved in cell wall biosynthesis
MERRMTIWFFSHYFPPEGNAPATRVGALTRRWAAQGHAVTVITGVPNVPDGIPYPGYRNRLFPQVESWNGVRVVRLWTWLAPNRGTVRRTANYLSYWASATLWALFRHAPDVMIATSPQFFCGWTGVGLTLLRRMRFVLEIRDLWPESIGAVEAIQNRTILRLLEAMERLMYRRACRIVTVGDGYRRRLVERGVPADKITVIPNGVDADLLDARPPDPTRLRQAWQLEGRFVCAYIGTIGLASGLEILLRAGRRLQEMGRKDIVLLAVGDGAVREELEAEARRQGLDNVRFTGRRPKDEMPDVLALADVCLVHLRKTPLFETVLPSKIFEAAGMGRPILIGVNGDARALVEEAGAGLAFEPEDEEGLVRALLFLADHPEEGRAMGARGRAFMRVRFNRDRLAADYLALLEETVRKEVQQ